MMVLGFKNPVFHVGRNVTVRRGVVWDTVEKKKGVPLWDGKNGLMLPVSPDIQTKVVPFMRISVADLKDEHDPDCRNIGGLSRTMQAIYSDFSTDEIVTVIGFVLTEQEVALLNG